MPNNTSILHLKNHFDFCNFSWYSTDIPAVCTANHLKVKAPSVSSVWNAIDTNTFNSACRIPFWNYRKISMAPSIYILMYLFLHLCPPDSLLALSSIYVTLTNSTSIYFPPKWASSSKFCDLAYCHSSKCHLYANACQISLLLSFSILPSPASTSPLSQSSSCLVDIWTWRSSLTQHQ